MTKILIEKATIELALEALGTMDVFNPNRMEAITALRQAIAEAEKQDNFCDANCVWTDHHPDCKLGQPDRQELQGKGEHPAPCARFCEANAFQIEIRNLKAKLEKQHAEWYHTKNIHGCDVFYHKSEERSYMSGEITPLYTTPPPVAEAHKRQPLTGAQIWQLVNDCSFNRDLHADKFARAIEAAHGIISKEEL